ncbi:flagellar hook-length control protein FliK [Clostridium beijerinckii]|uniref:Flagellar hook-length control protein FliK n=1 Tax=Clostridium beijerinckii TaxID=1520 RepID=A0A1S9NBT7_CLOBE|nr:flagellar hook-length control protein FliK [Clostridium beijerinckii]MZK51235.1 flagellar hook-length control protein FliK [Clostridium beijerinckii]MZK59466.1 flagellar hook-length control protein FliK [Clostridium beijerinckii]MZK69585.1 flagellar hook-length control protein FliK [Clostridium beijerinckii]MZK74931.1 flagellar hook-length control protein FliK [Clostridium beijerinckii]MZK84762.1 flagellar hook-length control protein FliK [Clostridium beijerinckii]
MPGIWNINNGYNINTKKISSKLTFEVGERFKGRVVAKGDGKDITVKLSDGWQFIAELEGNINLDDLKLVKFQVNGFENGKLKLKLVDDSVDEKSTGDESFQEIIDKEGLSKEDIDILKQMVKRNLPLTRDNINLIKGLIQFNGKISSNPKEIDAFIQTYLQSKNISGNSEEGQAVKEMLTKFLNEFKNMTQDDILTFIENNLDFSEESIDSFNKLFKGNSSIEQILKKMNESLNFIESPNNNFETVVKNKTIDKELDLMKNNTDTTKAIASKLYNENDPSNRKINVLDVLKTLAGSEDSELNIAQKLADNEKNNLNTQKVNLPSSLIEKLNNKEIVDLIKEAIGNGMTTDNEPKTQAQSLIESSNKNKLEILLSNIEGREVKLTDSEYKEFNKLLNNRIEGKDHYEETGSNDKGGNIQPKELSTSSKENFADLKNEDLLLRSNLDSKEAIKADMKFKIDGVRDIVKNLIAHVDLKDAGYEKIMDLIKNNINDIKVFNSISNEYYYLNIPINANSQEYPCKLIIKDNRKDGKKIDKTNAKMVVSVKTANLGEVDGYLTLRDNRIDVNLKCESHFTSILNNNKSKLVDGLSTLGLFVNISVSMKEKPVDLVSCRNFFNDLTISAIDIKV